jgi:hypothetical protein
MRIRFALARLDSGFPDDRSFSGAGACHTVPVHTVLVMEPNTSKPYTVENVIVSGYRRSGARSGSSVRHRPLNNAVASSNRVLAG